ncbi:hypothetical protein H257_14648 [Aphanomyces astaci]|uniref:Uncharacterized protein n=1 Tax=Aphanomyces astaci TaxID=112090 RepID=W4FRQ3_APHAT|nr:hypothetical protein H257_14648 [Aphanomyces astaci]ETV69626.1 hypothetical protein H257_14648 [Aphanomyces astaci]|eukprot:XP_009840842.1 hypothetical protein H257_14648 [Aphanomyces astaci]
MVHLFMKYHRADVTQYDTISLVEADWYDQPGTYEEVTTYDRKMFYPSTLGIKATTDAHRFEFPTKAGKVESNGDKRFEKLFAFSKKDHYTHTSLNFVMNVYKSTTNIMAARSAWGHLVSTNTIIKSEQQIGNEGIEFSPNLDDDDARYYLREILTQSNGFTFYKLGDKSKPYFKHQFRIKPFLLSHCRRIMANLVLKNADKVNRIMTDSITYEGNVEIDAFMFSKKDDMSGRDATIVGNSLKMF